VASAVGYPIAPGSGTADCVCGAALFNGIKSGFERRHQLIDMLLPEHQRR
jgi:hypothetical protein